MGARLSPSLTQEVEIKSFSAFLMLSLIVMSMYHLSQDLIGLRKLFFQFLYLISVF